MTSKRLLKAKDLLIQGKLNKALKLCNKVLSSKPDNCEALSLKGDCLSCLCDFERALKYYDKALAIDPNLIHVYFNKAECYMYMAEFDEIYNCGVDILDIDSTNAEAWVLKGKALYLMLNLDDALLCFEESLKLDSNNCHALTYKGLIFNDYDKFDEARKCLDKAFLIDNMDDNVLLGLSMNHYRSKNYKKALEYADMLFAVDPEHYTAFYVNVFSLLATGRMGEGVKMLNKALKVYPDDECFLNLKESIFLQS